MVKFYESFFNYDYPFPAVSLAYFLRYPNPYATHVLSTDVIDRTFDPSTQRLHSTRLHLKRSKIPPTILKLLPKGILGASSDGGQSYILEKSVVDVREGWMKTETRNLEWTGILSIVEKQYYRRSSDGIATPGSLTSDLVEKTKNEGTDVTTTVTLLSRFGQAKSNAIFIPRRRRRRRSSGKKRIFLIMFYIFTSAHHRGHRIEEDTGSFGEEQGWHDCRTGATAARWSCPGS